MKQLSYKMYQINEIKAEGVIEFMGDRYGERMDLVSKLIMILIRNGFNLNELAKVALHLGDAFKVDLGEVFRGEYNMDGAEYFANFLIRKGIQKEAFSNFDQSRLTGEPYVPKDIPEDKKPIRHIFNVDDQDAFSKTIGSPKYLGYRKNREYLFWAALLNAVNIFKLILPYCTPDKTVIKIAIRKGNMKILQMIFETEGVFPHRYMKYFIRYHRNSFFDNVKTQSDFDDEELLNIARDNLNFHAYSALLLNSTKENNNFANI
jgi:hypothetical protein